MRFTEQPNSSYVDFGSIQKLQHSVCERLAFIKGVYGPIPVKKQWKLWRMKFAWTCVVVLLELQHVERKPWAVVGSLAE